MFHNKVIWWINACLLLFYWGNSFAQGDVSIHNFRAPSIANVSDFVKDKNNFLWVSTQEGLYRFDSKEFLKIPVRHGSYNSEGWAHIKHICYNRERDQLLISSPVKGLAIVDMLADSISFEPLQLPSGIAPEKILSIGCKGDKYIIQTNEAIYLLSIGRTRVKRRYETGVITFPVGVEPHVVESVSENRFFQLGQDMLLREYLVKDGSVQEIGVTSLKLNAMTGEEFFALNIKGDSLFLGSSAGLVIVHNFRGANVRSERLFENNSVFAIEHTEDGIVWVAAENGVWKYEKGGLLTRVQSNTTAIHNDLLTSAFSLYADRNKVWIGCQNGFALAENIPTPFFRIESTSGDNRPINYIYEINQLSDGRILMSGNEGLFEFTERRMRRIIDTAQFFLAFSTHDNKVIVSEFDDSHVLEKDKLVKPGDYYDAFKKHEGLAFNDREKLGDSVFFLSTENERGVFVWNYKRGTLDSLSPRIGQTNGLYKNGDSLFILSDTSFFIYDIRTRKVECRNIFSKNENLRYGFLFDVVKRSDGYYFSSYGNGIIHTNSSFRVIDVINEEKGLSNNCTYRIIPVQDTLFYISTNNGINILNLNSKQITILTQEDGLHGNMFEEFSATKIGDQLFFGGKGGVTIINPEIARSKSDSGRLNFLEIEIVMSGGWIKKANLLDKDYFQIPNTGMQTTIRFQNIVYPLTRKTKYRYKIIGLHQEWIDLGTQNFITLMALPPKKYHLQVQSYNEDSGVTETKNLILHFLPKWYQTMWFKIVAAILVAGIVYAIYRLRIAQIKKVERIRRRLASDLHDDLGSTFNSIKVYSNLALMQPGNTDYLFKIKEGTQDAINGIRDMIWVLDDKKDTVGDLLSRVKQFATPLCEANQAEFVTEIHPNLYHHKLGKEEKRNLYLIVKEVVNNCIKYAACGKLSFAMELAERKLSIVISDNGKGFDPAVTTEGNGLKNIAARAAEIGYRYSIKSKPGYGTEIRLEKA